MKYFAVLATLAASALAQSINIASPAANSTVYRGEWLMVEVDKPDSLTGSTEVALVLSLAHCPSEGCAATFDPATAAVGQVLYNGPYSPQYHPETGGGRPPYQNFSVPLPASLVPGDQVALIATHVDLVGAGPFANLETKFVPLTVVQGYY
ncbi:hypothetical protein PsYK624_092800 [Phanerochaete sordida]|uniref:Uncharacterized protein n=1 Tax=Phanerochaete sordida TaxID=48140 RepID=A0A9P3GE51_9APHY|nr:hypothetical protein PsYK624_092800 [Phanerochaete sordida]